MNHTFRTLFILSASTLSAFGQNAPSNPPAQNQGITLEQKFKLQFEKDKLLAEKISSEKNIPLRKVDAQGRLMEFSHFDANGNMVFHITDNVGAGRTISTNKVWPGGIVGTSLTGNLSGSRLGEWDGGGVLTNHQEYVGRVTQADVPSGTNFHATHVAGTMIASGVNPNAKGMSYQATLKAYDWNSDASEMSAAAAAGMLLSNHSYGTISGWYNDGTKDIWYGDRNVSNVEDYKFGFYDQTSANWDDIAYNNQNYLICKSAGNDRGDNKSGATWQYQDGTPGTGTAPPADGQYDCISTYSGAKNVLTVGAVNKINSSNTNNGWTQTSDVVMSSFSGWGPMDDGRIKPDVVGAGVNLFSSLDDSTKAYGSLSGTSMATPNVCGSLLLVQQHYNNLKGKFMKAATLKGLVIQTADEAGNAGPDYKFGWGLVNISKAVMFISDSNSNQIQERTLSNGNSFSQNISSSGGSPLRITLSWTDPAGNPVSPSLDPPDRMLVNDLDIRLVRQSDNVIFYPYILNKDTPANVATTGNNIIDNVEQIYLAAPAAGNYTLTVSHKGALASAQNYSLLISGLMGLPSASFQASTKSVCSAQSVTYTDMSSGSPTSRTWYFPGGTPSTSTAAVVNVTYNTAGKYPVSLVVSNTLGKDSINNVNYITVGGLTLPFTENFENNSPTLTSWTIDNTNNDTTWRLATIGGTTPGNTAYCMPFYNYSTTGRRDGLITPALSFKGYSAVSLTFQHAYTRDLTTPTDSLVIWVSTNCGSSWTRLLSKGENNTNNFRTVPDNANEFIPTLPSEWCSGTNGNCITLNLNAYAGLNNVKIKFEGYNRYSNNLYLDNISITGTALLPTANFYSSKKTVCVGEGINFYDSTINIATNWDWTFTGAATTNSTLQNPTNIIYNIPGTYAVKLKSSNASGADSITKTNYITVVNNPGKPNVTNLRPTSFCAGDSTILKTDSSATTYQWTLNGSAIGGASANQLIIYQSGKYRIKTTNSTGCTNLSDSIVTTSNPIPAQPTLTSDITGNFMCTGGTAQLTSSATSGNQWYKNGNQISGATNKNYSTTDSGNYNVQVIQSGCSSAFSNTKSIAFLPTPNTSNITGNATIKLFQIESYSVTSNPGSTYAWTVTGGTKTSGGTTASIQVQWTTVGSGNVSVQESGNNGCKGTTKSLGITIQPNTGLNEVNSIQHISLFPNPASHEVNVKFESFTTGVTQMNLVNVLGQQVYSANMNTIVGWNEKTIALNQLEHGVYFIEITQGGEKTIKRLMIQ